MTRIAERPTTGIDLATVTTQDNGDRLRMELTSVTPLVVENVESSYFADRTLFPDGSAPPNSVDS